MLHIEATVTLVKAFPNRQAGDFRGWQSYCTSTGGPTRTEDWDSHRRGFISKA